MVHGWKLKRAASKMLDRVLQLYGLIVDPLRRRRYNRTRSETVRVTDGARALTDKVAIFLIYQPKGVPASVFVTCNHLNDCGYAVLLVSNGPLAPTDMARLSEITWRTVQRPNFGYDFGGYREAVLLLNDWGVTPRKTLILNDSIWFPIDAAGDVIPRLEASGAGMTGLLRNVESRVDIAGKPERTGFLESYCMCIDEGLFRHPAFVRYWANYRLTDAKKATLERGERGFSRAMERAGASMTALASRRSFLGLVKDQPNEFLLKTLQYAAYTEPALKQERDDLLQEGALDDAWRECVLDHITRTVHRRRFNAAFIYAAEKLFGLGFLKKQTGKGRKAVLFDRMRAQYLRAVDNGDLPASADEILHEIRQMVGRMP